ncbi:hypothetical protein RHMOL_Rhmol02G0189300 [Rhododendron molle]|uniref:Uncharacterized protein n=1 Tax=Rhododendron molle TaxID=49168 RepID=A0ACC0PT46_RHOML|nr:hypothetical protein RHMOL_Rhmol02G0189300 [Rhododendron molle]
MPATTPSANFPTTPPLATAAALPHPQQHTRRSRSQLSRRRRAKVCKSVEEQRILDGEERRFTLFLCRT